MFPIAPLSSVGCSRGCSCIWTSDSRYCALYQTRSDSISRRNYSQILGKRKTVMMAAPMNVPSRHGRSKLCKVSWYSSGSVMIKYLADWTNFLALVLQNLHSHFLPMRTTTIFSPTTLKESTEETYFKVAWCLSQCPVQEVRPICCGLS